MKEKINIQISKRVNKPFTPGDQKKRKIKKLENTRTVFVTFTEIVSVNWCEQQPDILGVNNLILRS